MSLAEIAVLVTLMYTAVPEDESLIAFEAVEVPPVQQEGSASWYGGGEGDNGMHGAITATGEPFRSEDQTCASRTIPLNTSVLVENLDTGGMTVCRINDRGPYWAFLDDGTGVAQYPSGGKCVVRHHDGTGWTARDEYDNCPGTYRDIMDLSRGTAEALDFDFDKGLNRIRVRYFDEADHASRIVFENMDWSSISE